MDARQLSPLDRLLEVAGDALRTGFAQLPARRPPPESAARDLPEAGPRRREAARLMRVNHAGEVAAQGLYSGHALTARMPGTRDLLHRAAAEEADHLAWCRERLAELGSRHSFLDPVWFGGSVVIGALAGLAGDSTGLGFVAETERQVEGHLDRHLVALPAEDRRSRAIVASMKADEIAHAEAARRAGAIQLPRPAVRLMGLCARIMTGTARWI